MGPQADDPHKRVAAIITAIRAGTSPVEIERMMSASMPEQLSSDMFIALRTAVGEALDRVGIGSLQWDAFYAILNELDDANERGFERRGENSARIREARAAYASERILHSAEKREADGTTSYDTTLLARAIKVADGKGLLAGLGATGEELRNLGNVAAIKPPAAAAARKVDDSGSGVAPVDTKGMWPVLINWQRNWLIGTIVMAVCWTPLIVMIGSWRGALELGLLLIGAPSAAMYALFRGGAWMQRRFRGDSGSRQVVLSPGGFWDSEGETIPTEPGRPPASAVHAPGGPLASENVGPGLRGVRGWLLGFCLALTVFMPLISIGALANDYQQAKQYFDRGPGLVRMMQLEAVVQIALVIFSIYAGYLLWAVKPGAVTIAKFFLFTLLAVNISSGPVLGLIAGVNDTSMAALWSEVPSRTYLPMVWFLPLMGYLRLSKRVRATYGAN